MKTIDLILKDVEKVKREVNYWTAYARDSLIPENNLQLAYSCIEVFKIKAKNADCYTKYIPLIKSLKKQVDRVGKKLGEKK